MTPPDAGPLAAILSALGGGLPELLLHFVVTLALLAGGVAAYTALTPFHERSLVDQGNTAAGTVLAGAVLALALPLAAMLATSGRLIDIVVWGVVAVVLQLLTMLAVTRAFRRLGGMIEAGNTAAALVLAATQCAVGLLNAAVMVPT